MMSQMEIDFNSPEIVVLLVRVPFFITPSQVKMLLAE